MPTEHSKMEQWIIAQRDNGLAREQQHQLAAHLATCSQCQAFAAAQPELEKQLLAIREPVSAEIMRKRSRLKSKLSARRQRQPFIIPIAPVLGLVAFIFLVATSIQLIQPETAMPVRQTVTIEPAIVTIIRPTATPTPLATEPVLQTEILLTEPPPTTLPTATVEQTLVAPTLRPTEMVVVATKAPAATATAAKPLSPLAPASESAILSLVAVQSADEQISAETTITLDLSWQLPADTIGTLTVSLIGGQGEEWCNGIMTFVSQNINHTLTEPSGTIRIELQPTSVWNEITHITYAAVLTPGQATLSGCDSNGKWVEPVAIDP